MAQKVAKLGIERDLNFMYYIKNGDVWRVPRKQAGMPKGKKQQVAKGGITMDSLFIYFLDKDGDISRAKRRIGGMKRKKKMVMKKKTSRTRAAGKTAKRRKK
jgi:hypothetical protein